MAGRFPDEYAEYAANVPAFVPRPRPWRRQTPPPTPFRWSLYLKHGEWKVAVTYLVVVAWLVYRMRPGL
jgi:hypothetical protein